MKNRPDSILSVVHETAKGLRDAGIMNDIAMREFDALCLFPVKTYQPQEIKKIRLRYRVSQAVFAAYLNVSKTSVASWESGERNPALRQSSCLTWWIEKVLKQLRDPQISEATG